MFIDHNFDKQFTAIKHDDCCRMILRKKLNLIVTIYYNIVELINYI